MNDRNDGWISVLDEFPSYEGDFLVTLVSQTDELVMPSKVTNGEWVKVKKGTCIVATANYSPGFTEQWHVYPGNVSIGYGVSHWMPLPSPAASDISELAGLFEERVERRIKRRQEVMQDCGLGHLSDNPDFIPIPRGY